MAAFARTAKQFPLALQKQQLVFSRSSYQNPYYARFKNIKISPDFHKQES